MRLLNTPDFISIFNGYSQIIIAVAFFVILLLALFIGLLRGKLKKTVILSKFNNQVLAGLIPEQSIEKHINQYLEMIMPVIEAEGYFFYLFDSKSDNYLLRVSRQAGSNQGHIVPSYSGLVPYDKEKYNPPLGLSGPSKKDGAYMIKDGAVPLVEVTVKGADGLIRIGPVRSVSKRTMSILNSMGDLLQPALTMLLAIEKQKNDVEMLVAKSKAISGLAKSNNDADSMRSRMMLLSAKMIDAGGCCLIISQNGKLEVPIISGLDKELETQFRKDHESLHNLVELVGQSDYCQLTSNDKGVYIVPLYLVATGLQSIVLFKVSGLIFKGVAVFWHYHVPALEQHRIAAVKMLVKRLGDFFDQQSKFKELSNSYIGALRSLLEATDNLEPHTVGHSDLIANYSMAIAKELKLSTQDVQEIKLAGYFHDVGMLGLSSDILFKPGKYTTLEYDTMKLHSEVGASIGESTLGNANVSSYIRHHHERWDGYGYPHGLHGEEIPLGARIIAVADMFTAKLGGRKYREPATFERAIADLLTASGTQLDPVVVEAFLKWFRKKQSAQGGSGRSLGPCWAMRCCPPSIHKQCIAFEKTDRNCWELEGVNCAAHGNSCESCFVHTEVIYRSEHKFTPLTN